MAPQSPGGPAKKAAAPRKAASKRAATKKAAAPKQKAALTPEQKVIASISDEAKEAIAKAIMTFDEPSICPSGRRRFLAAHGLPVPPRRIPVTVAIEVEVEESDLGAKPRYRGDGRRLSEAKRSALLKALKEQTNIPGMTITAVSSGYLYDND